MALIAHWPLNGNLNDISGNNDTLNYYNNNNKILDTSQGKIGSAKYRAGLNDGTDWLGSTNNYNLQGDFSFAIWAKVTSTTSSANGILTNHNHSNNTGAGINVKQISSTDFRISCNTGSGTGRTYHTYYGSTNIYNRWAHLVLRFIKATNTFSLWVDGVKDDEFTYAQYNVSQKIGLFSWSLGYNSNSNYRPAAILNDARVYNHALTYKEIQEIARAKILHYTFDDFQQPTTNMIEDSATQPGKNTYPTIGNEWGTYWTGQYNSNTDFSIGSITSISNNEITVDGTGRTIYTYDVLNPATSGGGVTAGTNYFIKKTGTNSFTLHAYNNSQDGSQGYINPSTGEHKVHDNIANDTRISVNSTNFPTMWHGAPHLPNAALVKEIIPNDYESDTFNGHSFVRMHFDHHAAPQGGMAYGVYIEPQVSSTQSYTFSLWYRAANPASVGKTFYVSQWSGGTWNSNSGTLTCSAEWKKATWTSSPPTNQTTSTYIYFWPSGGSTIDVTEIQVENRTYATPFTEYQRSAQVLDYSAFGHHSDALTESNTPKWVNSSKIGTGAYDFTNSGGDPDTTYNYIRATSNLPQVYEDFTASAWIYMTSNPSNTNVGHVIMQQYGSGGWILSVRASDNKVQFRHHRDSTNGFTTAFNLLSSTAISLNTWYLVTIKYDGTTAKIYIDGSQDSSYTIGSVIPGPSTAQLLIGAFSTSGYYHFDGYIDDVRVYATSLSDADISDLYKTRGEIGNDGTLYVKDLVTDIEPTTNFINAGYTDLSNNSDQSVGSETYITKKILSNGLYGLEFIQGSTSSIASFSFSESVIPVAGQSLTFSADVKSTTNDMLKSQITVYINGTKNWLQNDGSTWSTTVNEYNDLFSGVYETDKWIRISHTIDFPTSGTLTSFSLGSYYRTKANWTLEITNVQLELKDYATSFTPTQRLPIPEIDETSFNYGENGVQANGITNFKDISTVGITNGLIGYWQFNGDTLDYSGNKYHAVEYSSGVGPIINSDNIEFESGDGLKVEGIISEIDRKPFTIIIMTAPDALGGRIGMGYSTNTLELNISSSYTGITLRDSGGYRATGYNGTMTTGEPFLFTGTFDGSTLKYYHNGEYASQYTNHLNNVDFGDNFLFGNWTSLTQSYQGKMYYAKFFNRALTAEEIKLEYNTMFNNEVQIDSRGTLYAKDIQQD